MIDTTTRDGGRPRTSALALAVAMVALVGCKEPPAAPSAAVDAPLALAGGTIRHDVRFACGDGTCAAWLFVPPIERPPVVVIGHGFAGTRDVALPALAERFAREDIASLVFDYRHFGASSGAPRQLVDPWKQLDDWRAAIEFVRASDLVDGARVALLGTSLGAGHALLVAADDPDLTAVVVQVPLVDTGMEGEATFYGVGWALRLVLTGWADLLRAKLTGQGIEIAAIAPAGGFGMIVDDAAYAAFEKLAAPGSSYRNAVLAHSAFTFDDYDPSKRVAEIGAPILVVASRGDRFAPFAAAEALAALPNATLAEIEGDHFDVYSPPVLDAAAATEARFLREHLMR
jgi:pimeloyl-ACP methyl ester carboxylesterase